MYLWVCDIIVFVVNFPVRLCQVKLFCINVAMWDPVHDSETVFHTPSYEPRCEKTGLWGFRPGLTQTGLYSHKRWIEA